MHDTRPRKRIYNLNRYLIIALLIIGFVVEGFSAGDVFFLLASSLWLWLPECNRLEKQLFTGPSENNGKR